MEKIDVIMPCWIKDADLVNLTENAVNSIRETGNVNLIIVDNGSPIGGGALREWADLYIRNKENRGYAPAVNEGLKMIDKGKLVCITNNDVRPSAGWQEIATEILEDPKVCSVHFRMIPYDQPFNPGTETSKEGRERWCSSSFFVVRADRLYDEHFFNTYDDWDMWKWWRSKGFKQAYTNKAEYQHLDSSTVNRMEKHEITNNENREYFKKKWGKYPEDDFAESFPEQIKINWKPFP